MSETDAKVSPRRLATSRPLAAAIMMVLGAAALAGNQSLVRVVTDELHPFQVSALRFLFAVPIMLPWILRDNGRVLHTRRHGLHFVAAVLTVVMTAALFVALALLPLAETIALNFTAPAFTVIIAAVLLKERVDRARQIATVVGFIGVLIILRPGIIETQPVALLPILYALLLAFWFITIKRLGATESTMTVTVYQTLWSAVMLLLVSIPVWQTPSWHAVLVSVAMAGFGTASIFLMGRAFEMADASLVAPFDYSRLPIIAVIGFLAFDEVPDLFAVLGAIVIAGSAIFIIRREAAANRRRSVA